MDAATRELVKRRAGDRCEYCRVPQAATPLIPFHVEHIIARQHEGSDSPDNLAIACDRCNAHKGPNLTSIAQNTGAIVRLFNPRQDTWEDHFRLDGGTIVGLTPCGRVTARLLNMNAPRRVQLRE
jgi:5-methylcytosine-specific restriction endonuclease McrA